MSGCAWCAGSKRMIDSRGAVVDCVCVPAATITPMSVQTNGKHPPEASESPATALFRRWSMAELLAEPDTFAWLVKGLWVDPSYGQIAGEMKTLKSFLTAMMGVGVASGQPILGRFTPLEPRPVLVYVGEGGRRPYVRRLRRICEAMGVEDPEKLPFELVSDVAPIQSDIFAESLARDLYELQPGLVILDPLYAYHGSSVRASDLHQEGGLLTGLSNRCMEVGASLLIVNHMNQTGAGHDLKRITMAGSGEWVDSWMLVAHREDPDVDGGMFKLRLDIGSRQWGGTRWDLDLSIGRFDEDLGAHDGTVEWDIRPAELAPVVDISERQTNARAAILDLLAERPAQLTKTQIEDRIGSSRTYRRAWDSLVEDGLISHSMAGRIENGTTKRRLVWALASQDPDVPPATF